MSYKPDESVLISWLYGELDETEKAKVEAYFQENPAELRRVQELGSMRNIMANIQEKEVIAPPLFMDDERDSKVVPLWRTQSFRTIATIAASLLIIMVAASVLNLRISYSDNELRISFGKQEVTDTLKLRQKFLTTSEVQDMIDESSRKSQQSLETRLAENRTALDEAIRVTLKDNTNQINNVMKQASTASQSEIRAFAATLQRENLSQMRDYLQLSQSDQRKYTDNLLTEFARFLQEQRAQDINVFATRFNKLEQNTDELKSETELILASIVSNSQQVQQSSY